MAETFFNVVTGYNLISRSLFPNVFGTPAFSETPINNYCDAEFLCRGVESWILKSSRAELWFYNATRLLLRTKALQFNINKFGFSHLT